MSEALVLVNQEDGLISYSMGEVTLKIVLTVIKMV